MYLNYDGAGGQFGDTSIDADTSNIANSAVYASVDSTDPNRMVVVAINRTGKRPDHRHRRHARPRLRPRRGLSASPARPRASRGRPTSSSTS